MTRNRDPLSRGLRVKQVREQWGRGRGACDTRPPHDHARTPCEWGAHHCTPAWGGPHPCCYCTANCGSDRRLVFTTMPNLAGGVVPPNFLDNIERQRWFVVASTLVHALVAVADPVTDVLVAVSYTSLGHTSWAVVAWVCIALGYLASCISGAGGFGAMRECCPPHAPHCLGILRACSSNATTRVHTALWVTGLGCFFMCLGLGPVVGVLAVLYGEGGAAKMVKLSKLVQGLVESLPLTMLQSFAVARSLTSPDTLQGDVFTAAEYQLQALSMSVSVVSLSMTVDTWREEPRPPDVDSSDEEAATAVPRAEAKLWGRSPGWLKSVRGRAFTRVAMLAREPDVRSRP